MRPFRFAFVSNSAEVGESVRSGASPATEDVALNLATMEEAVPVARELLANGIEVVIGAGGTGNLLAENIGQPVVKLERSPLDIIGALKRARESGSEIALTSFARPVEGLNMYEELLSVRIHPVCFSTTEELADGIARAVRNGCRAVVGGGVCRRIANAYGIPGIVVVPRKEEVLQTLQEARAIAAARRNERRHIEELSAVLETIGDGLVLLDSRGRVKTFNDAALATLRSVLPSTGLSSLIGHLLPAELRTIGFDRVLQTGEAQADRVCRVGNLDILVSSKPITVGGDVVGVIGRIRDAACIQRIDRRRRDKSDAKGFIAKYNFDQIVGGATIRAVVSKAARYASTDAAVLIEGETGTGKELLAQSIHNESRRRDRPFLAVNCSAFSESLLESELFGYEDGAFTGARRGGKVGLFELANGGTLFLDEIADMSPSLQTRLLRVLEEKEIMRLGGDRNIPVDVRTISSSQRDLLRASQGGRFRADLYFRLATLRLRLPPLRERMEDACSLMRALFAKHGVCCETLPPSMADLLGQHSWPGNVRELEALVRTYLALAKKDAFDENLFVSVFDELRSAYPHHEGEPAGNESTGTLKQQLRHYEQQIICRTLQACRQNRTETARRLGISINSLWRKSRHH